jgi:hypothetical protein
MHYVVHEIMGSRNRTDKKGVKIEFSYTMDVNMVCQLTCFYVILCDVWTRIGVSTDMVVHNNINTNLLRYTFKLNKEKGVSDMVMHNKSTPMTRTRT